MKDILMNKFSILLYKQRDLVEAKKIYNELKNNDYLSNIKDDFYGMVAIMYYYTLIDDSENLSEYLKYFESNLEYYTKYQQYFYYYFYSMYFLIVDFNTQAAFFTLKLINVNKFKKYIDFEYKDLFYGIILATYGYLYNKLGKYNTGENYSKKASNVFLSINELERYQLTQVELGLNYIESNRIEEAKKLSYNQLQSFKTLNIDLLINLGYIELFFENYKKALIFYEMIDLSEYKNNYFSKFEYINVTKRLGALIHYFLGDKAKSKEILDSIDMDLDIINKGLFDNYKLLKSLIYEDYSKETYEYIIHNVYRENNVNASSAVRDKICDKYIEMAKHIVNV